MNRKFMADHAKLLASILAIVALLLFIPAAMTESTGLSIVLIVAIVLLLAGGIVLIYLGHRANAAIINYFLYDAEQQKKIPRHELSFELVEKGLQLYLEEYIDDPVLLWDEIPQPLRMRLGDEPQFRPLIAYRMLYALSDLGTREICVIFSGADERTVTYICRALADAGDSEMADFLFDLKGKGGEKKIVGFFAKNRTRFEERMLGFVKANLREFDLDSDEGEGKTEK